jgi:hypothetical protein
MKTDSQLVPWQLIDSTQSAAEQSCLLVQNVSKGVTPTEQASMCKSMPFRPCQIVAK